METQKKGWFFIINPRAGSGKTMSQWMPAERKLQDMGVDFETECTNHKRHAISMAYNAAEEGYRRIIAVGGDGTIHEAFTGIMRWCDNNGVSPTEFYIGVFPIGSGNDWIKSVGLPHDGDYILRLIKNESFGLMDVVRVKCGQKCGYMVNVGGVGFDSHVCERANARKAAGIRGKAMYLSALRYTMLNLRAISVRVVADGHEVCNENILSIALGNGKYSGGGMRQVPLAKIDDGLIDYFIVPKLPIIKLFLSTAHLFKGDLHQAEGFISGRCNTLEIIPNNEESADIVEIDGEIEGNLPATISISGQQINVLKG